MTTRIVTLVLSYLLAQSATAQSVVGDTEFRSVFPRLEMPIEAGRECPNLEIYVAQDPEQRARGLMFVTAMPARTGMLFIYPPRSRISMWMKNTVIPLDIVFIDENGVVLNIAKNTTPFSLTSLRASDLAGFALELNAGMADELGIIADRQLFRPEWLST